MFMPDKPTYEKLEHRVKKLEEDLRKQREIEEQLRQAREEETQLLEMTNALSQELNLDRLLVKIMQTAKVEMFFWFHEISLI